MNECPTGGKLVAPLSPVGEFVFVDLIKFDNLPFPFLSLQCITQFCIKQPPLLGAFIIVVSVISILLYFVRQYISSPNDTLR